jgi:hypothetical protein
VVKRELDAATRNHVKLVTAPLTVVESYDARIPDSRLDWTLPRPDVPPVNPDRARQAIRLLAGAGLPVHTYALGTALAVAAQRQECEVTVSPRTPTM